MIFASIMIGLALAAAQAGTDEAMVENSIRDELSRQGRVLQVEMTQRGADHLHGFAVLVDADGVEGRVDCTAQRTDKESFAWDCLPVITEPVIRAIEGIIRTNLAAQGEVLEIDMDRANDQRMVGRARLRTADGTVIRANCTADRENPRSRTFNWECLPDE
jgi:hypothetical protein